MRGSVVFGGVLRFATGGLRASGLQACRFRAPEIVGTGPRGFSWLRALSA